MTGLSTMAYTDIEDKVMVLGTHYCMPCENISIHRYLREEDNIMIINPENYRITFWECMHCSSEHEYIYDIERGKIV